MSDSPRLSRARLNYAGVPDVGGVPGLFDVSEDEKPDNASPTGEPWRKCCEECQFRDKPTIEFVEAACAERKAAFHCVHREDDAGHYRVCAGYAARDATRRLSKNV